MNAVFSFDSRYMRSRKSFTQGTSDSVFKLCWVASVNYARRYFEKLKLVTDSEGAKLLRELGLEFDEVSEALNDIPTSVPIDYWAYGKIIAYQLQKTPFLHIDYDVFITRDVPPRLRESRIICQSDEAFRDFRFYAPQLAKARAIAGHPFLNTCLRYAYNCGIFGGNDIETIQEYCGRSLAAAKWGIDAERKRPGTINFDRYNIIYEQYVLSEVLREKGIVPEMIFTNNNNKDAVKAGYIHLMGAKTQFGVEEALKTLVKKAFKYDIKDYYWRQAEQMLPSMAKSN